MKSEILLNDTLHNMDVLHSLNFEFVLGISDGKYYEASVIY